MPRHQTREKKPRASWKGELVLDLVSLPVAAFNAAARGESEVHFHQLHAGCHSRIRTEKMCPIHGELAPREIVSGYEFQPDLYVEVRNEELARIRSHREQVLTLEGFVDPSEIDPIFYDGRSYYLVPDDEDAVEPYAVLNAAIKNKGLYGVGEVVFSGREQLVVVRPHDGLLVMQMLNYRYQVRKPGQFIDQVTHFSPQPGELAVAEELVEAYAEEAFDIDRYRDVYEEKLRSLVNAKLAGEEIVASPEAEVQPRVINLNDALRRSVDRARSARSAASVSRSARPRRVGP